jgi:putative adhesin
MPTFTTPGPVAAIVEAGGAKVRVTASNRTDTVVLVEPLGTDSRSARVAEKTEVEYADGRLAVKTTKAGEKSGSIAITIDLPTGSSLAAYLAHSSLHAEGSLGASELHVASGQVRLDRTDTLKASIASGEVAIGHVAGRADIDGTSFTMRIAEAKGTVGLSNAGGQVWIGHASGDLELGSATGDFDIDRADANVTAKTASGTIRIGRMTAGRARLTNGSGDIEVGINEGTAASIDANSERGAVHNFVSSPLEQGEPGPDEARVSVFARTRHGDITVQRSRQAGPQEASVTSTS